MKFSPVSEATITKSIVQRFYDDIMNNAETDVVIIGGGPSGLMAARDLSLKGIKTLVIETNNFLGGGFWVGGYFMNGLTFRAPSQEILDELGISYEEVSKDLYLTPGHQGCSKLIAAASDSGATFLNMTRFDDVVLREGNRVAGVVINWSPVVNVAKAISCLDPVCIESRIVIDATGHDAVVASSLAKRGLLDVKGMSGMWVNQSEDAVVDNTREVYPGLIVCGMAAATVFGLCRMGPTFGGMLVSGRKAAQTAVEMLAPVGV